MKIIKIVSLLILASWSIWAWKGYFQKKNTPPNTIVISIDGEADIIVPEQKSKSHLTNNFWKWEAEGRLNLIDLMLDDEKLANNRNNWSDDKTDLRDKAKHIITIQLAAYGLHGKIKQPDIQLIPLRADANGLYIASDRTIYLNSKMQWQSLSFERFVEVVLHENMHHIITYAITAFDVNHGLRGDFEALVQSAFVYTKHGMANENREPQNVNPQELVAYRTQRAARYAGIIGANLSAWEMSTRTQEIRVIKRDAGFN